MLKPLATETDNLVITKTDGQIIALPDWADFPEFVTGRAPNIYTGWFNGDNDKVKMAKVAPYKYVGQSNIFYPFPTVKIRGGFTIELVHFVDSGHIGWYMTMVIGTVWETLLYGVSCQLTRAYDINVSDGLSPYGRYGMVSSVAIDGGTNDNPSYLKGPYLISEWVD